MWDLLDQEAVEGQHLQVVVREHGMRPLRLLLPLWGEELEEPLELREEAQVVAVDWHQPSDQHPLPRRH